MEQMQLDEQEVDSAQAFLRWSRSVNPTALLSPTNREHDASNCRLLTCGSVSPTCSTKPDNPRFEIGEFRTRAAEIAITFFATKDIVAAVASIAKLDSMCFHDALVALMLRAALGLGEDERNAAVKLMSALAEEKLLSQSQLVRGFEKLVLDWKDIQIEIPDAPGNLVGLLSSKVGLLDKGLFVRLPEDLLEYVCSGLQPGTASDTLKDYLKDMVMFNRGLEQHLEKQVFGQNSAEDFGEWLRETDMAGFHHEVVFAACSAAVKAPTDSEKQTLVLDMLERFHSHHFESPDAFAGPRLLTEADVQLGFARLVGAATNLTDNKPDAVNAMIALLRGVVERALLPAEFLRCARRLEYGGPLGVRVLREAQRQTPVFSRRVWGSGDLRQMKEEIREAILEYFDSGNAEELGQILSELHLSDEDLVQFLRKLLVNGMELGKSEQSLDAVSTLMGFFWSEKNVQNAFDQVQNIADDLVLDFPQCREHTKSLLEMAHGRGILGDSYLAANCICAV